jgi:sugar lactone lactonase YvrE
VTLSDTISAMKRIVFSGCCLFISLLALARGAADLQEAASFPDQQVTGVAVSKTGRVPRWSDDHGVSVAEIVNGQPQPYPNEEWNKPGEPASHFVCVQSVYVDESDHLWILDPASPKMQGVVKGGPKLLKVDLQKNKVVQVIRFNEEIAPTKSYLNDVRIDLEGQHAFITDSGLGAIVVVDLKSGKSRRVLDDHPSTKAEDWVKLIVDGRELLDEETRQPPRIHADGIALTGGFLYYHALTGRTMYRIGIEQLKNAELPKTQLEAAVEKLGETPSPDGMLAGRDGSIYMAAFEVKFDPATRKISMIAQDHRLQWPDSMSWGPDGMLYVTASQIQNMPRFNWGQSGRIEPYKVFKLRVQ